MIKFNELKTTQTLLFSEVLSSIETKHCRITCDDSLYREMEFPTSIGVMPIGRQVEGS